MKNLFTICLMFALVCAVAYGKKFPMTAAAIVPGARADVEVGKDKNGNTELKMTVQYLASPEDLTPPRAAYLVWLR